MESKFISRRQDCLAFFAALGLILIWLISGPFFGFSDTWQLVINTGTTIITFLMVFLIQNTQNRETKAINLKLDELIRAVEKARNNMVDLENASDEELMVQVQFQFAEDHK
jgi:low affinity Fe/Cu permease